MIRLNDELAAFLAAQQQERIRAGRVLHDQVGQLLTAAGFHLDSLRLDFGAQIPGLAARVGEIQSILEGALTHLRELSTDLHPALVRRLGLGPAMHRLVAQARSRGVQASLEMAELIQVPDPPATGFHEMAARALAFAEYRGAKHIVFRVSQQTDAYVSEVLYDVASPDHLESLMCLGLPVSVTSDPCGTTVIRTQYSHAIRGSAG